MPIFPEGVITLTPDLGVCSRDGQVTYFYGTLPVFTHASKDVKSFNMFMSQLYVSGKLKQSQIANAFGVTRISIKRAVKIYETDGPGGFWKSRKGRGPAVLTTKVLQQVQELLDQGLTVGEVALQNKLKKSQILLISCLSSRPILVCCFALDL